MGKSSAGVPGDRLSLFRMGANEWASPILKEDK